MSKKAAEEVIGEYAIENANLRIANANLRGEVKRLSEELANKNEESVKEKPGKE